MAFYPERTSAAGDAGRHNPAVPKQPLHRSELPLVPISVSARHVHLRRATLEALFGSGHELEPLVPLHQPGQFAARETVTLIGPRGRLPHVRVLGPLRDHDQVEISRTDELALGIEAPVRESGDLACTPGLQLEGPAGSHVLESGVLRALRHIHMSPEDAARFGVRDQDRVDVAVCGHERGLTFSDVIVRVSPRFRLEMHVDTDEGNAAGLVPGDMGLLIRR